VDPAVVNLTAFETYFPEKRPFFVEGAGYFQFGMPSCFFCEGSGLALFYSRRIGRTPQGTDLTGAAGLYASVPGSATILGAAKITGRTTSGWSLGLMNAVTARERARVADSDGHVFRTDVEPPTNYFVGRVAKDYRQGNLQIRGMATSVARDLRDPALAGLLDRHAETAGLDADWWFGDRRYRWALTVAASQVAGDSAAITRVQRSSARYLQRPDRDPGRNGLFTSAYDPALTAMRGWAMENRLSREAGDWLWEVDGGARSPGFETNDMAFLTRADYLWLGAAVVRRRTTPVWLFRRYSLLLGGLQQHNFDGDRVSRVIEARANVMLHNYWSLSAAAQHRPATLDDQLTRGGPEVRHAARSSWQAQVSTDSRKRLSASVSGHIGSNAEGSHDRHLGAEITVRPSTAVNVSLAPVLDRSESTAQYVTAVDDATAVSFGGRRYVFADLAQRTLGVDLRMGVAFSPTLTFDLYMQPLLVAGAFTDFKEFVARRTIDKRAYGRDVGTISEEDGRYIVDPDGVGIAPSFVFDNPDFNFRSLRGNAVLRWEFRPGSTLYLAWTHMRSDQAPTATMDISRDWKALLRAPADNVLLVKLSYWIGG
jgi:hypothetical protein